jgi:hypothetical protein
MLAEIHKHTTMIYHDIKGHLITHKQTAHEKYLVPSTKNVTSDNVGKYLVPSTKNVTSDNVGLLTYCSPKYT